MKVRGAYWAELSPEEGVLVPAGVLVASKTKLLFKGYPEFRALEERMQLKLDAALARGLKPGEVLDYYVERSNGVTVSVSRPMSVDARSIDDAAERLLAEAERKRR